MIETTAPIQNAIIFLLDYNDDDAVVPDYIEGQLTAANTKAISVGTRIAFEGDVAIRVYEPGEDMDETGLDLKCSHELVCTTGNVSVVTSDDEQLLSLDLGLERIRVQVWADDDIEPERVFVGLSETGR